MGRGHLGLMKEVTDSACVSGAGCEYIIKNILTSLTGVSDCKIYHF